MENGGDGGKVLQRMTAAVTDTVVRELSRLAGIDDIGGAIAGSVAATGVDEGFGLVRRLQARRRDRVVEFAEVTAAYAPEVLDDLLTSIIADPIKLDLLVQAIENTVRSHDAWKVDLLGRIFVAGAYDEVPLDQARVLLETTRQLETPHLRLLKILNNPGPHHIDESYNVGPWTILSRNVWRAQDIKSHNPGIADALDLLVARLQGLGLIRDERVPTVDFEPVWVLTPFGLQLVDYLSERGRTEPNDS